MKQRSRSEIFLPHSSKLGRRISVHILLMNMVPMYQDGGPTVLVETAVLGVFSYRFREGALPFLFY